MLVGRSQFWITCLLTLSLLVAGCGSTRPGAGPSATPLGQDRASSTSVPLAATSELPLSAAALSQVSPLPTPAAEPIFLATAQSQVSPLPTSASEPIPPLAPGSASAPIQLVVLHTNDNWGETEPCG